MTRTVLDMDTPGNRPQRQALYHRGGGALSRDTREHGLDDYMTRCTVVYG